MSEEKSKKPLYTVDELGSIPPEVRRIREIHGITHSILRHSSAIGEALAGLRHISYDLAVENGEEQSVESVYTFPAEPASKEELLRVAGYLDRLNIRLWSVSRALGTQAQNLADKISGNDDEKFGKELDEFLKTETVSTV